MTKDTEETLFANEEDLEQKTVLDPEDRTHKDPPAATPAREVVPDRTSFAQEGLRIGVLLAYKFKKLHLSDPGISTAGGVLARQSIVLTGADRRSTVIGWLDATQSKASLRSYETIARQSEIRKKSSPHLGRDEYERLCRDLSEFFREHQIAIEHREPEPPAVAPAPSPQPAEKAPIELTRRHVISVLIIILAIGMIAGSYIARCGTEENDELEDSGRRLQHRLDKYRR